MENFLLEYAKQTHANFRGYYANLVPDVPIALGSVGTLDEDVFYKHKTTAKHFGFKFKTIKSKPALDENGKIKNHYIYKTSGQTDYKVLGKGESGLVNGGLGIDFSGNNAFFFNLAGVKIDLIEDQLDLEKQIIALYKAGEWKKEYVVVTQILHSSSTVIIGSRGGEKSISLEAKAGVDVIDLQSGQLQLSASGINQQDMHFVTDETVPLFQASKLKYRFFKGRSLNFAGTDDELDLDTLREEAIINNEDLSELLTLAPIV